MRISRDDIESILHHASDSPAQEVCGLLLGCGNQVLRVQPVDNISPTPENRFELDLVAHLRCQRQAREADMQIIGHYHSHPSGVSRPSIWDAEMAHADALFWLICTSAGNYRMWQATGEGLHGMFQPVEVEHV